MKKVKYKFVFNRKDSLNKKGKALIQLRLTKGSEQKYCSTGVYIKPGYWDEKAQEVKKLSNRIEVNKFLADFQAKIERFEFSELAEGRELDFRKLNEIINDVPQGSFIAFMEREIGNSNRAENTIKSYRACLSHLTEFKGIEFFKDVNYNSIVEFDTYLKGKVGPSTVHKYHRTLKLFIKKAINHEFIKPDKNPYLKFTPDPPRFKSRKYLTVEELKAIEEKELHIKRLNQVRDLFLFSCYTGLSYADIEKFSKDDVKQEDGISWIDFERKKTGEFSFIPLLPKPAEILLKYDYKLPIKANQNLNGYLKEIQTLCGLSKNLTFHMARHTFATTITLSKGVPLETVSKMLGHSNTRITQVYAKILRRKIKEDTKGLM